ncbi:AraC family ligand binding domain-containing protein [Paenibacillus sp. NPDC058071]|uniref:AraC family ligand binding domain-containing protein n=1 Tax=Paenibacillus sp. NPDC058071 TaxID=3346326 RepID=UPI0036D77E2B
MSHTEFYQHDDPQPQMELRLRFFGKQRCEPLHSWGPGLRDTYLIHYIISGKGTFTTGGATYQLSAGQGFLITPSTLVHYEADESDPWVYSWIGFDGMLARTFLQRAGLSISQPIFKASGQERKSVKSWFDGSHRKLTEAYRQKSGDLMQQSLLYRYFAELIECTEEDAAAVAAGPKRSASKEAYIREAIAFIENSYSQKVSVQQIAAHVGLDATYLSGLFKQQFELSLQTFLLQFRMNRAASLLANPELSVSDVARSVGYPDPFLFSKMFKRTVGIGPRSYRNQLSER